MFVWFVRVVGKQVAAMLLVRKSDMIVIFGALVFAGKLRLGRLWKTAISAHLSPGNLCSVRAELADGRVFQSFHG